MRFLNETVSPLPERSSVPPFSITVSAQKSFPGAQQPRYVCDGTGGFLQGGARNRIAIGRSSGSSDLVNDWSGTAMSPIVLA